MGPTLRNCFRCRGNDLKGQKFFPFLGLNVEKNGLEETQKGLSEYEADK